MPICTTPGYDDLDQSIIVGRSEGCEMAQKPPPQDADDYEGAPLSLGSIGPAPVGDRPPGEEVARTLARAIAEADESVRQRVLDYLDGCTRRSRLSERARAAEAAAEMIRELLRARGGP